MAPGPGCGVLIRRFQASRRPSDPTYVAVSTVELASSRCTPKLNCWIAAFRKFGSIAVIVALGTAVVGLFGSVGGKSDRLGMPWLTLFAGNRSPGLVVNTRSKGCCRNCRMVVPAFP